MKRFLLLCLPFILTGCMVYGSGETVGYVYAVDDGILWDKVWYKSNLQSSESDCYLISDDSLKQQLRELSGTTKIKLKYRRHFATVAVCNNPTDDEITSFEIVE